TVTAQLLSEIQGPRYLNPDATARFDSIRLDQAGPDRVRVSGVRGEPPPATTKVCINYLGGYRNSMTFVLAGLDVEAKAETAEQSLWAFLGGLERFAAIAVPLVRSDRHESGPLGTICGARSGDKGGNANVGVWARNAAAYAWLAETLTVDTFRRLVPEAAALPVERHALPNLWSLNFVVHGLLGDGVAASTRSDPQAKSL